MTPARELGEATVRPATEADLDRIVDTTWMVAEEGRWIGTETPFDRDERRRRLATGLADPARSGLFVAEVGDFVVGHIDVLLARYGVASLGMLVVDGYRGRGIGGGLIARGIEWARAAGAHKVALEVWPHNQAALALYRRYGFEEEGRLYRHYRRRSGELWDAVVMGLALE